MSSIADFPEPSRLLKLLVVDDARDSADTLAELLRLDGHQVRVAYDAGSASACMAANPADCVLLDVQMPGTTGTELATTLRQRYGDSVVIVGVTGIEGLNPAYDPRVAGMDHCLVKPVSSHQLRQLFPTPPPDLRAASATVAPAGRRNAAQHRGDRLTACGLGQVGVEASVARAAAVECAAPAAQRHEQRAGKV